MVHESRETLSPKASNVSVLHTNLGMTSPDLMRKVFEAHVGETTKALIIRGWATGTVNESLLPLVRETTERGVSVFILSDNPADSKGIQKLKYEPHVEAVAAGAIPLKDVNINQGMEVLEAIQEEIDLGKTGKDLNDAIADRFGTPIPQPTK